MSGGRYDDVRQSSQQLDGVVCLVELAFRAYSQPGWEELLQAVSLTDITKVEIVGVSSNAPPVVDYFYRYRLGPVCAG